MDAADREQWRLILTPAGTEWSGRTRYAAAMYFYQKREMTAEVLEIYRICSRIDHEDAVDRLKAYRMGQYWVERVEEVRRDLASPPAGEVSQPG